MPDTPDTDKPQPKGPSSRPTPPSPKGDGRRAPGAPARTNNTFMGRGGLVWLLLLLFIVAVLIMMSATGSPKIITWDEFKTHAQNQRFEGPVIVKDDRMIGTLKESATGDAAGAAGDRVAARLHPETRGIYVMQFQAMDQSYEERPSNSIWLFALLNFGPVLLIIFIIYFFFIRSIRNSGGGPGMLGSFGRSKHKVLNKEHSSVTLGDVAGIDEAKDEVGEIIQFLKNPKKFQRLGGRVPRGVLLIGLPGCGKTLLAKAVAGEADVPFFSISGSDFVEMFVGVGASRVRDLFKQAKDSSPCIIFLDEIDAVGRRRGQGTSSGGHDEREQTLNAILVEMDGFDSSDQVIVMAATNRSDVLDPALTRPGRFDRSIEVPLPDVVGRFEILKVHAKKIKLADTVDLERIARATPMFSGAELAALINEAAIGATLADKDFVEHDDLEEARDKVRFGRANKSRRIEEEEKVATAYHEAGHAVIQYLLEHADPLHKVTIIPRGRAMGSTMSLPEKDRHGYGAKYLHATMRVLCGGRIAEQKKTDDVSSGASMDITMMTRFARAMILQWGMSDRLGFVNYEAEDGNGLIPEKPHSDETARVIDEEVKRLADEAYAEADAIINNHWDDVVRVAEALLQYETIDKHDVDKLMKGEPLAKPTVAALIEAERKKAADAEAAKQPEPATPADAGDDEAPGMVPSPA